VTARYRVYGLGVESEIALPELAPAAAGAVDVRITRGAPPDERAPQAWSHEYMLPSGEKYLSYARGAPHLLRFHGVADFLVGARGDEVVARPVGELPDEILRHIVLDNVLPLVLNLREKDALHATAVVTPRGLCALMGVTGAGKSTLAAAFALAGHAIACDDCLVVTTERARVAAHAGYAGLRLTGESVAALGVTVPGAGAGEATATRKRRVLLGPQLETFDRWFDLAGVYALASGEDGAVPRIEPISGRDAFTELAAASFRMDVDDAEMLARQLALFAELTLRVPPKRLVVPRTFAGALAARDLVLRDIADATP
jgi:hypothetical protein